jgi:hypothetical protein
MANIAAEQLTRAAERLPLAPGIPATLGDYNAKIVEISLIGCRVEHDGRMAMNAMAPLQFYWQSQALQMKVRVARSEMRMSGGRSMYVSGIEFCKSIFDAPRIVTNVIASMVREVLPAIPAAAVASQSSAPSAPFLELKFENGFVSKRSVWAPKHPTEGITIASPAHALDVDRLCHAFELADVDTRRQFRAAAELIMARDCKRSPSEARTAAAP